MRVRLRPKNQITLPQEVVQELDLRSGDELVVSIDKNRPGTILLRALRQSYSGVATGLYGAHDEISAYVQAERSAWDE